MQDELSNRLPPIQEETVNGEATVLKVFHLTGARRAVVAGCRVKRGNLIRDSFYRVTRNDEVLYEGEFLFHQVSKNNPLFHLKETHLGDSHSFFFLNPMISIMKCVLRSTSKGITLECLYVLLGPHFWEFNWNTHTQWSTFQNPIGNLYPWSMSKGFL